MLDSMLAAAAATQPEAYRRQETQPGIRVSRFDGTLPERTALHPSPGRLEALFCLAGRAQVALADGRTVPVGGRELLLISGLAQVRELLAPGRRFSGILVSVETDAAQSSLERLGALLGWQPQEAPTPDALLRRRGGFASVGETPWSDAAFAELEKLPPDEQGQYCVLKALELLYLLGCRSVRLPQQAVAGYYDDHQVQTVRQVRSYMAAHLDEPLTIAALCRRFHLSSTLLKSCFRTLYGKPIHSWLRECRMQHAADLLSTTSRSVAQVAAEVGYGSTSQFGVAFKAQFQMTPSQYRRQSRAKNV